MGSLMGGWDSQVVGDDTEARRMRNRSLTTEEVQAFRRQQGKHDGVTSPLASPRPTMKSPLGTSPFAPGQEEVDTGDAEAAWWTRSSSAFLNEPPQEDAPPGTAHSYTPQFDVAAGRVTTQKA
ncbi:unnamed protein product [Alopecurus aequalis]